VALEYRRVKLEKLRTRSGMSAAELAVELAGFAEAVTEVS
jgi:hypothetical protein